MTEERAFWLAWSQVPGIGPVLIRRLHQQFGSLAIAWTASPAELEAVEGLGELTAEAVTAAKDQIDPTALLQEHLQTNSQFLTPADTNYPRLLFEIPDPPPVLYYQGKLNILEGAGYTPAIAIVGTRNPSDYGRRWTQKISRVLAEAGFTIVSGLAAGIDTIAHYSCLKAQGQTIAVLGTGVDVVYPWSNRDLARQIAKRGLLLSEYPAGTQPDRIHFPRRNRIIAGLSRATLVLEAPEKSGSLITARLANDYGRDVYTLPGSLDNPQIKGCLELLNQGAQVILGEEALLKELGTIPQFQPHAQLSLLDPVGLPLLPPELQSVFQAIPLEPIGLDRLVEQTGLPTADILSALSQLEIMELVSHLPGMRYQKLR